MKNIETGKLLRIFIGESDRCDGKPLHEKILYSAKELSLAGATVIRGIAGFGAASNLIHTSSLLRLSEDLPILIEMVDSEEKITAALKIFDEMIEKSGSSVLITMENVEIIKYGSGKK